MKQAHFLRAMEGGLVGAALMTALFYVAPVYGGPKLDIAALLASLFGHAIPATSSTMWWAGMVWHFVNGTVVFPMIYASFIYGWLPGPNWVRGALWGLALWAGMEVIFMPITGGGMFNDHATHVVTLVAISLIAHAIYGTMLGLLAADQAEHTHQVAHPA